MISLPILLAVLSASGCTSTVVKTGSSSTKPEKGQATAVPGRALSRVDLDHVIDEKMSKQEIVSYLKAISIEDFDIQDPKTNWSFAAIGSAESKYSIYYLTYRQRYFIFLLMDVGNRLVTCLDVVTARMPSSQYELGMGIVEINHDHLDSQVVVIYNKKWKEGYSDDVITAFKPNLETERIEVFNYQYIRIFREE